MTMTPEQLREKKAEHVLADEGVFAGNQGLRGLYEAREFWAEQPYGTRLYFGGGITQYLHHSVLGAAIEALDKMGALQAAHAAALEELARVKKAISESCDEQRGEYFGCRRAERAEAALAEAERKIERLTWYADEFVRLEARGTYGEFRDTVSAYRAEFKG